MFSCLGATIPNNIEKVDIYLGHSLLQTWPLAHRTINIEVDPLFPPDTLIFRATGSKESLEQAKLEIKDLSGSNIIQQINPATDCENGNSACFTYILNQSNLSQIKDKGFRVMLDKHHETGTEIRSLATIMLDKRAPAVTDADPAMLH